MPNQAIRMTARPRNILSPAACNAALCDDKSWLMAWPRKVNGLSCIGSLSCRAERNRMDRIAHAIGHVLHGVGEVLLEVNGVIDRSILRINLLLLGEKLLLYGS